jgi:4-amino-4-deoxy-L-arabinose transferase-like glycosyltransferase
VSATAALAAVVALYLYALPRFGPEGALGAGLVAATSAGWFGLARYANLDMTLTACLALGVLAGLAWLDRPPPRRPPLLPYIAAGLGTLVKGPLAVALVAGPLLLAALARRPRPSAGELGLARGLAIAVALAALLYVPVGLLDPSYLGAFAATNVRRWSAASPHPASAFYYLLWVPALLLPWTLFAAPALVRAWRDPAQRPHVLWAAFVPALLTLPRGKLATYALSALVPLALVVGPELARVARAGVAEEDRAIFRVAGWLVVAALALAAGAALAVRAYPVPLLGRSVLALTALGWAAVIAALLRRAHLGLVPLAVVAALATLYPLGVRTVAPGVAALHSERDAARIVADAGAPPVIAFAIRDPSLSFYLRAPVIYTSDGELARDVFAADGLAFLVTSPAHFGEVEELLGARAHLWWGTRRRRLYANRPPMPGAAQEPNGST